LTRLYQGWNYCSTALAMTTGMRPATASRLEVSTETVGEAGALYTQLRSGTTSFGRLRGLPPTALVRPARLPAVLCRPCSHAAVSGKGVTDGFQACGCFDQTPTPGSILAGGPDQTSLDQRPPDDPRLRTWSGLGHLGDGHIQARGFGASAERDGLFGSFVLRHQRYRSLHFCCPLAFNGFRRTPTYDLGASPSLPNSYSSVIVYSRKPSIVENTNLAPLVLLLSLCE
jgi:hypothetical protein